jgi:uncharacterized protein (UPF0335 family)
MANDKYYGYSPKKETRKPSTGVTDVGTRLDRVNPYEFRKGMDVELTSLGVSRLQESTPEEREKATETVLKNLEEHGGYYSAFIHYETEFRNSDSKPNFKTFLKEFYGDTAMKEVTDKKDNQMEEPKYDKKTYTTEFKGATEQLKEAIKKEVVSLLSEEDDDKKMDKDAAKSAKKGSKAKIAKQIDKLAKERKDKEEKRQEFFDAYKKTKKDKKATEAYKKKVTPLQDRIKDIDKEVKDLENELAGLKQEEKDMRREAAGMMMDKKVHLEILKMIKEVGVPMTETAGVKMYYEVAKMAYMEGLTAGMSKE